MTPMIYSTGRDGFGLISPGKQPRAQGHGNRKRAERGFRRLRRIAKLHFLPSTVKQWNILPDYNRNASGIYSF